MVTRGTFAAAVAAWTAACALAATADSPIITCKAGRYADFIVAEDGRVILFSDSAFKPTLLWRDGKWTRPRDLRTDTRVRQTLQVGPGRWLILGCTKRKTAFIYAYSKKRLKVVGRASGLFYSPTFHVAADGAVWILSRNGVAYGLKDGKQAIHRFGGLAKSQGVPFAHYPPTRALNIPSAGTWFWSQVDSGTSGRLLPVDGLEQHVDGRWRHVPVAVADRNLPEWAYPPNALGGAVLFDAHRILCGTRYAGLTTIDIRTGKQRGLDVALPAKLHCTFLHRTAAGRILMVGDTRESGKGAPDDLGRRGKLLEVAQSKVQELLSGVDNDKPYYPAGRPAVETPAGTFLAAWDGGLVFVPRKGDEVRRIDWRRGFPLGDVSRLRARGDLLYALDAGVGFAIVNWRALLAAPVAEEAKQWEYLASCRPPRMGLRGSFWHITPGTPNRLRGYTNGTWREFTPMNGPIAIDNCYYMAIDTKCRLWLLAYRPVFVLDGKDWREFDSIQEAYATIAREEVGNKSFRVGQPSDSYFPAFAGDGRVAFQPHNGPVHYFDGKEWRVIGQEQGLSLGAPCVPPFFHEGKLTIVDGGVILQNIAGDWRSPLKPLKHPYASLWRNDSPKFIPKSYPGPRERLAFRTIDNQGALWIGSSRALYRGKDDLWARFPTRHSPLTMMHFPIRVMAAPSGDLWFVSETPAWRIAHFQPAYGPPRLAWADAPEGRSRKGDISFRVCCSPTLGPWRLSYRVNAGARTVRECRKRNGLIELRNLKNGQYQIEVNAHDNLLRASPTLAHRFRVERDYQREVAELISRLRSPEFEDRARAAARLVALGEIALPALKALAPASDEDTAWWRRP